MLHLVRIAHAIRCKWRFSMHAFCCIWFVLLKMPAVGEAACGLNMNTSSEGCALDQALHGPPWVSWWGEGGMVGGDTVP